MLEWGPGKPSTTHPSVNMTMAFAIVSFSAVNIGLVMRRERQAPWSSPVFPYLGWIILGWILTWAAVELGMLQRLLDTTSLTGREWIIVLALSLIAPAVVAVGQGHPAATPEQDPDRGQRSSPGCRAGHAHRGLIRRNHPIEGDTPGQGRR